MLMCWMMERCLAPSTRAIRSPRCAGAPAGWVGQSRRHRNGWGETCRPTWRGAAPQPQSQSREQGAGTPGPCARTLRVVERAALKQHVLLAVELGRHEVALLGVRHCTKRGKGGRPAGLSGVKGSAAGRPADRAECGVPWLCLSQPGTATSTAKGWDASKDHNNYKCFKQQTQTRAHLPTGRPPRGCRPGAAAARPGGP